MDVPLPVAGETVSHYKILKRLDAGGMGVVFAARDLRLGRQVAVKFLSSELCTHAAAVERFEQEARAASSLNHPNICTVHDVGRVTRDGTVQHFLVMELLEGTTLKEHVALRTLSVEQVLGFAIQIAAGLEAAHDGGVIHRDVKPANLFITSTGVVKLLDFGLAKLAQSVLASSPSASAMNHVGEATTNRPLTSTGLVIGTVPYMSPEQVRGDDVDRRTDLFSFGAVLYEMATRSHPFAAPTPALVVDAVLHKTPAAPATLNPALPRELDAIILKSLEKDRAARYQHAAQLRSDLELENVRRQRATRPAPMSPRTVGPRRSQRHWVWGIGLAVLTMLPLLLLKLPAPIEARVAIGPGGRPAVAVHAFDTATANTDLGWLRQGLSIMLITGLAQTPGLDVISAERLDEVAAALTNSAPLDKGQVLEVARRAGAGALVTGRVFGAGSEVRIDAQVQDVATGRVIGAETVQGNDVFVLADDLTRRLHRRLRVPERADARAIRDLTSGSVQAYRHYVDGVDARRNLREVDARAAFEQAVATDPTFALAYFPLAEVCERLGDLAAAEQYRRQGRVHLDRLPERQQLFWGADEARRRGDFSKAVELLETLIGRYPDEEDAYVQLAIVSARELADTDRAIAVVERGVLALPNSAALRNEYGYRLLWAGRLPEALQQFETYVQLRPSEPNPYDSLGEAYLVAADPQRSLEEYARALEIDPSFGNALRGRAWAWGMLGRYDEALDELSTLRSVTTAGRFPSPETHFVTAFMLSRVGRYDESARELTAGLARAELLNDPTSVVWFHILSATIALERGRLPDAERAARRALASADDIEDAGLRRVRAVYAMALAGIADARAGQLGEARSRLETLEKIYEPTARREAWPVGLLKAEIALAQNTPAEAAILFAAAEPATKMWFSIAEYVSVFANALSLRDGVARARQSQGDVSGAIEAYRLLTTIDLRQKWSAVLEPRFVLALARLLERAGDRAGALREYQRFLELWSKADEPAPELREARMALAPR